MTLTFSPTGSWLAASAPLAVDAGLRGITRIARRFTAMRRRARPDGRIREELVARLGTKGALRCWVRGVMDLVKRPALHHARDNHGGG